MGATLCLAPAAAAVPPSPCWDSVRSDLDGGGPDIVVGLPSYDLPGKPDAGAIVVYSDVAARGDPDPAAPALRTVLTADHFPGCGTTVPDTPVEPSQPADDEDVSWAVGVATVPGEDLGSVADAGVTHLGVPPGRGSVALIPPVVQAGAGTGMAGMRMLVG